MNLAIACAAFLGLTLPLAAAPGGRFDVTAFGAAADGKTLDTEAIAKAVAACAEAGGGTVFFPAGRYLTGSIVLGSNMTLHLDAGSELLYSPDPKDSPIVPSRWEGTNAYTHGPLIYANGRQNVAVTGRGTINGQGAAWWWRNGAYDPARTAQTGPAHRAWLALYERIQAGETPGPEAYALAAEYLRPSLVQFYRCRNVLVEGVTLTESPMWMLHPIYCEDVSIRGVTFQSTGPNTDGVDVDSSCNVRITGCYFNTGDDCIVLKSGRDADGRRTAKPTEHVTISNCIMYHGHGAVAVGSETAGGIRDVTAGTIVAVGTERGIRIKSMRGRGGVIENMRFDNFVIDKPTEVAVEITGRYFDTPREALSERTPVFRNLSFSNITVTDAPRAVVVAGLEERSIENVRFTDLTAKAAAGFECSWTDGIELMGVRIEAAKGAPFTFAHVRRLSIDGTPRPDLP